MEEMDHHIEELEKTIAYSFHNKENLVLALTHSSYANESKNARIQSNERLEFLGDAVLNIVISEYIYRNHSNLSEGEMTKVRSYIVCEPSLMRCSENIKVGGFLLLGKGEEQTGGRKRISILSDAFEALIGAIYIDGGFEKAKDFIMNQMQQIIKDSVNGLLAMDYKTQLQEVIQRDGDSKIVYEIIEEKGPDHNKLFVSQIKIGETIMGTGEGKSKKEAEQNAAKLVLQKQLEG
ncbi:MAG: ribonuclease III [Clostridia bacterium]|nr:ribonuclease III [Clostridia bacterium]